MATSIFRIELALDGKVDFLKKTNPYGAEEKPPEDDEALAETMAAAFRSHKNYRPAPA